MKLKQLITTIILFISFSLFGQKDIDSLIKVYKSGNIYDKIETFYQFFLRIETEQGDSILYYINDLRKAGIDMAVEDAVSLADYAMASYSRKQSLFKEAEEKLFPLIDYYLDNNNDTMLVEIYNALGNTSFLKGDFVFAEKWYKQAIDIPLTGEKQKFTLLSVYNLARMRINEDKIAEAMQLLDHFFQVQNTIKSKLLLSEANALVGQTYLNEMDFDNAEKYFNKSVHAGLELNDLQSLANSFTNLGILEFLRENFELSKQHFQYAVAYHERMGIAYNMIDGYFNMSAYYYELDQVDSAFFYMHKAEKLAKEAKLYQYHIEILQNQAAMYYDLNDKDKQIEKLEEIIVLQGEKETELLRINRDALSINYNQEIEDVKGISKLREQILESRINRYENTYVKWIIISVLILLVLVAAVVVMKKK